MFIKMDSYITNLRWY